MTKISIQSSNGGTPLAAGNLKIKNGLPISSTLQIVSDESGNDSVLKISTIDVTNNGGGSLASNTAFGQSALDSNTTGVDNAAFGLSALTANLTGDSNTAFGHEAAFNTTASNNTAIGRHALRANSTGFQNTAVGSSALRLNTGTANAAVGFRALQNNDSGGQNTAVGADCLGSITSGVNNTAIGFSTGGGLTTGSRNTIIGANVSGLSASLSDNIIIADGNGSVRIQTNSSGNTSLLGNVLTNFIPSIQTSAINLTINSANQDTFCGAVLEVTGALTITFDASIRNGFSVSVIQESANSTTFATTGALTLRNRQGHTKTFGQWSTVTLYKSGSDLVLAGDTTT